MNLQGKKYERQQIEKYIGRMSQIAGSRHYTLTGGKSNGVRAIDVNTGSGLNYTLLPDRCMDISLCSYKGMNLVYHGETGEVHPAYYSKGGNDWMYGFFAGLVTTCGLQNLSGSCVDDGESYGLHGNISYTPATGFKDLSRWEEDEYILEFEGVMEDSVFFGPKLIMTRNIRSIAGERKLTITDTVENIGTKETPFVILYHINAGFPLLDENSEFIASSKSVWGYDKKSTDNIHNVNSFGKPEQDFYEENFLHEMAADGNGSCYAGVLNKELNLGLCVSSNIDSLPFVSQWKMSGYREYVLAIEPVNTKVCNRVDLKREGILPVLKPGEKKVMKVDIGVLDGADELKRFEEEIERINE